MDCKSVQKLIDDYRCGSLNEVKMNEIESHLFQCEICHKEYESAVSLGDLLQDNLKQYPEISPHRLDLIVRQAMEKAQQPTSEPKKSLIPASFLEGLAVFLKDTLKNPIATATAAILLIGAFYLGWQVSKQFQPTPEVVIPVADQQPSFELNKSALQENFQAVKSDIILAGNYDQFQKIRQMEDQFNQLVLPLEQEPDTKSANITLYRQGEAAFMEKNLNEAQSIFQQILSQDSTSVVAFLSCFQLGNIEFENNSNFSAALTYYNQCLENFPTRFISEDKQQLILNRIDLISKNANDNYKPLRLYLEAKNSSPEQAIKIYQQLMSHYPDNSVSPLAVDEILHLTLAFPDQNLLSSTDANTLLISTLEQHPDSKLVPYIRAALGDIFLFRHQNQKQALLEYTTALRQTEDETLRDKINQRMNYLLESGMMWE